MSICKMCHAELVEREKCNGHADGVPLPTWKAVFVNENGEKFWFKAKDLMAISEEFGKAYRQYVNMKEEGLLD